MQLFLSFIIYVSLHIVLAIVANVTEYSNSNLFKEIHAWYLRRDEDHDSTVVILQGFILEVLIILLSAFGQITLFFTSVIIIFSLLRPKKEN